MGDLVVEEDVLHRVSARLREVGDRIDGLSRELDALPALVVGARPMYEAVTSTGDRWHEGSSSLRNDCVGAARELESFVATMQSVDLALSIQRPGRTDDGFPGARSDSRGGTT